MRTQLAATDNDSIEILLNMSSSSLRKFEEH